MKVYVVTANYCEDAVICGVAIDEETAQMIAECEENQEGIKPDGVFVEEYETDDYLPLKNGLRPFEVRSYEDGVVDAVPAAMQGFTHGNIFTSGRKGNKCLICEVYARDEVHALEQYFDLQKKN